MEITVENISVTNRSVYSQKLNIKKYGAMVNSNDTWNDFRSEFISDGGFTYDFLSYLPTSNY